MCIWTKLKFAILSIWLTTVQYLPNPNRTLRKLQKALKVNEVGVLVSMKSKRTLCETKIGHLRITKDEICPHLQNILMEPYYSHGCILPMSMTYL